MDRTHACSCGAQGDRGEIVEHIVTAADSDDDRLTHRMVRGGPPPEVVEEAAARRSRRAHTRARLADAAGVSVAELREVQ